MHYSIGYISPSGIHIKASCTFYNQIKMIWVNWSSDAGVRLHKRNKLSRIFLFVSFCFLSPCFTSDWIRCGMHKCKQNNEQNFTCFEKIKFKLRYSSLRTLSTERHKIHMSLAFALLLAQSLFLSGINAVEYKVLP